MSKIARDGFIWAWTSKSEQKAIVLNLEERPCGAAAWLGDRLLGNVAPALWVDLGYVQEIAQ